jgi:hypothetical protein
MLKRIAREALGKLNSLLEDGREQNGQLVSPLPLFTGRNDWICLAMDRIEHDPICAQRPQYIYGVLRAAAHAKALGIDRISVIEFGVAGGAGLVSMERTAEQAETLIGVGIDVYGFDTATGLPKPRDYRDLPNKWLDGYWPCDVDALQKTLRRARLVVGQIGETIPGFLATRPAPIGYVGIDVATYTSTKETLVLFESDHGLFMPRIDCLFRSSCKLDTSEFVGERLAISEFNAAHAMKKISPFYSGRHYVPGRHSGHAALWPDMMFILHLFDHPRYNDPDELTQSAFMDVRGSDDTVRVSEWPH